MEYEHLIKRCADLAQIYAQKGDRNMEAIWLFRRMRLVRLIDKA
jgi:hypothetical protein